MKLTRRGFLQGLLAAAATIVLPKRVEAQQDIVLDAEIVDAFEGVSQAAFDSAAAWHKMSRELRLVNWHISHEDVQERIDELERECAEIVDAPYRYYDSNGDGENDAVHVTFTSDEVVWSTVYPVTSEGKSGFVRLDDGDKWNSVSWWNGGRINA